MFASAEAELNEEDRKTSIYHARAAITSGSDDATTLAIAALVIWFDQHDVDTAFDLFDRALALSNWNVLALSNSAAALAWMGRTELAVERAQLALRLSPFDSTNVIAYNALAVAAFQEKRYEDARSAASRGIEGNPRFIVPRLFLTAALVRLGRLDEARGEAERVLAVNPKFTIRGFSVTVGVVPAIFELFAGAWREAGLPD